MGKSTPSAPDPVATASAQGAANIDAARESARLNRYSTAAPGFQTTWSNPDEHGVPTSQSINLNPNEKAAYDEAIGTALTAGRRANSLTSELDTNGLNIAGLPQLYAAHTGDPSADLRRTEDAVYSRYARTLDPEQAMERERNDVSLSTTGIPVGSPAWVTAMNRLDRSQASTRQDARDASVAAGNQLQGQLFGQDSTRFNESLQGRQQNINEQLARAQDLRQQLAALVAMGQGGIPNAAAPQSAQMQISPSDITGPTQANYAARQANAASNNQASTQAATTAASMAAMAALSSSF